LKKIKIPLISEEIWLYVGMDEWKAWIAKCTKYGAKPEIFENLTPEFANEGRAIGTYLWIGSKDHPDTVFHEVAHALSIIYECLNIGPEEEEFRAYIAGHVQGEVHKWLISD